LCVLYITGSGIGRLISLRFAKLGCRLVLWDVNEKGNEETAKLIKAIGAYVKSYTVDLSKREDIYNTAQKVCFNFVLGQQECDVLGLVKKL
jgi:NAD(P)-dependent dehydrogenase (short-subunit alcohol dehydrogenase family)